MAEAHVENEGTPAAVEEDEEEAHDEEEPRHGDDVAERVAEIIEAFNPVLEETPEEELHEDDQIVETHEEEPYVPEE